eukprot:1877261-Lingulodinium_polyedra.AAC.1
MVRGRTAVHRIAGNQKPNRTTVLRGAGATEGEALFKLKKAIPSWCIALYPLTTALESKCRVGTAGGPSEWLG